MEEADGGVMASGQLPSTAPVSLLVGEEDLPVKPRIYSLGVCHSVCLVTLQVLPGGSYVNVQ